jgi:hypothetical protein
MIRRAKALILVSTLAVAEVRLEARDSASMEERIRRIAAEAARLAAADPGVLYESRPAQDVVRRERSRMQALLGITEPGTELSLTLRSGRNYSGQFIARHHDAVEMSLVLTETNRNDLGVSTFQKGMRVKKRFAYEEIAQADIPLPRGWIPPEGVSQLDEGKRLELLLANDQRIQGRFRAATAGEVRLDLGDKRIDTYSLDTIVSARLLGRTRTEKWIVAGATIGGIAAIGALLANSCWDSGC